MEDLATNAKYPDDDNLCLDDWDTIKIISQTEHNFDSEKGFIDIDLIFQRKSDRKYFKVTFTKFSHNGDNIKEKTAIEVFKIIKTIETFE